MAAPSELAELRQLLAKTVSLNRDLTDRLVERHQSLSEADRAKTTFLASVSHEIRTPLHAIIGLANVLGDTELDDEQSRYVQLIRESGDHLLALINDILDVSKMAAGSVDIEAHPTLIHRIVDEATAILRPRAHAKGLELVVEVAAGVPDAIIVDGDRLRQILINLLGNGIKFTDAGHVRLFVFTSGGTLRFAVEDTGPGIPGDMLETIFEPFVSGQGAGAGLGLSISQQLARAMDGDIHATSIAGQGSRFTATIPCDVANTPSPWQHRERLAGRRIHIVDDHRLQRHALAARFKAWGCEVSHGGEATVPDDAELALVDRESVPADWLGQQKVPCIVMSVNDSGTSCIAKPPGAEELYNAVARELLAAPSHAKKPRFDPDLAKRQPLRILVAEDNAVNQVVARGILGRYGYGCTIAATGRDAAQRASDETFELILMDLQMPEMDGLDATVLIREHVRPIPYIAAMTAHASPEDRDRCIRKGMDAYLTKPVRLADLKQVLDDAWQRSQELAQSR